ATHRAGYFDWTRRAPVPLAVPAQDADLQRARYRFGIDAVGLHFRPEAHAMLDPWPEPYRADAVSPPHAEPPPAFPEADPLPAAAVAGRDEGGDRGALVAFPLAARGADTDEGALQFGLLGRVAADAAGPDEPVDGAIAGDRVEAPAGVL